MTRGSANVLIVEDAPTQAATTKALTESLGHRVRTAETASEGLAEALAWQPNVILLDIGLPDFSGLELLRRLREAGVESAVIVITAQGSVSTAVEAMRAGAADFIVKPFSKARLSVTLENVLERCSLTAELRTVRAQLGRERFFGFIGASPAMQAVYRVIESVAPSRATVFITGESGTGKELVAEAVHKASPRRGKSFVAINCGAIPRDLVESELFGHVKGSFTGATENRIGAAQAADGGTLFLDEIGELPLDMQVKLLRFVQTGTLRPVGTSRSERVDVRLICATNRDPLAEVEAGRFREDLYYRLYVVPIELPPLRERGEDVLLIARHILARLTREEGRRFRGFARDVEETLLAYPWPGNVRQLENVLRSVVVLNDRDMVTRAMLPAPLLRTAAACPPVTTRIDEDGTPAEEAAVITGAPPLDDSTVIAQAPPPDTPEVAAKAMPAEAQPADDVAVAAKVPPPVPAPAACDEILPLWLAEKRMILIALERTGRDVPRAASLLEVNPSTIYRKLHAWRNTAE